MTNQNTRELPPSRCGNENQSTRRDVTNVDIKPMFPEKLDVVKAYQDMQNGRIAVSWERTGKNAVTLKVEAAEKLHGIIAVTDGYKFADGSSKKPLQAGNTIYSKPKEKKLCHR